MEIGALVFWGVVNFILVKWIQGKFPNLKVNEWLYALGGMTIGALWTWIYLAYKVREHKCFGKYNK